MNINVKDLHPHRTTRRRKMKQQKERIGFRLPAREGSSDELDICTHVGASDIGIMNIGHRISDI